MNPAPAPVDPAALGRTLAPFGHSVGLPGAAYTSAEVYAWEQRHLYEGSWVCTGRSSEIPSGGGQRAVRVGQEGVLLVRDHDGTLRGFSNVCCHRGHELLAPDTATQRRVVQCPYHAWTYGLDGRLRAVPRFGRVPGFTCEVYGLGPTCMAEWNGFVFVNAMGDAPDLAEHTGDLDRHVEGYGLADLVPAASLLYEIEANWKFVHEGYHECYHCPQIHPQFCPRSSPWSGENHVARAGLWSGGSMEVADGSETMSYTGARGAPYLPGLDARRRREVSYLGLLPNLLVSGHPDYVMTHRIVPRAPDRTWIECQFLFPADVVATPGFDPGYAADFWDATNRQDWAACESMQRGAASRGFVPGPLSEHESALYDFVIIIVTSYLEGAVRALARRREPALV